MEARSLTNPHTKVFNTPSAKYQRISYGPGKMAEMFNARGWEVFHPAFKVSTMNSSHKPRPEHCWSRLGELVPRP